MKLPRRAPAPGCECVTRGAPHVRGIWSGDRIWAMFMLAMALPLGQATWHAGPWHLVLLAAAIMAALGWQAVFARLRRRALGLSGLMTAMAVVTLVPPGTPWWQVALAVSFGIVFGEQVFGGPGRNFLNPAMVALAFLLFSFPDAAQRAPVAVTWASVVPGALVLLVLGLVPWRVMAGAVIGAAVLALAAGSDPLAHVLAGGFVFAVVFLACDPVGAAATEAGRWLYGIVVGVMTVVGAAAGPGVMQTVVFAVLIGGIFAPLFDQAAIAWHLYRRGRRHG